MDISQYNTRVIQEPRGMIRIITLIFAILAFATTSGFDTYTEFKLTCFPKIDSTTPKSTTDSGIKGNEVGKCKLYVEYPFQLKQEFKNVRTNCENNDTETKDYSKMDFSSSAQFYVATGVLSFLYSTAVLVLYIFGSHYYESNPLIPVIDLVATVVLTIFWLAGASAWAAGVSDVKHYTDPGYLYSLLKFCQSDNVGDNKLGYCSNNFPGKFTSLNISLIFGFANILLWGASAWFVFKETQFHRKPQTDQMGPPAQQGFDQFSGQQMPGQTTQFPQQRQFSDGY